VATFSEKCFGFTPICSKIANIGGKKTNFDVFSQLNYKIAFYLWQKLY